MEVFRQLIREVVEKFRNHKENVEREAGIAHMIEAADERAAERDARSAALVQREADAREKKGNENPYFAPMPIIVI
jgi:metal-responsive CopG/Arc/MetJ family transcriptional regulator